MVAAEHIPLGVAPSACPTARSLVRNAAQAVRSPQRMPACIKAVTGVGVAAHRCFIRPTSSWFRGDHEDRAVNLL